MYSSDNKYSTSYSFLDLTFLASTYKINTLKIKSLKTLLQFAGCSLCPSSNAALL